MRLGPAELIIILVIVIILFGPGRLGKVFGELGKGLRSFKDSLGGEKEEAQKTDKDDNKAVEQGRDIKPK